MKGQHGGPGRGQGRKPGSRLHLAERIELAIECARRWEAMQDRDAKDRQDTLDDTAKGRKLKALRERFVHRDAGLRRQPSRGRLRGDEPPKTLEGMRLPAKDNDEFYKAKEKISKEIHKIGRIYTTRKKLARRAQRKAMQVAH